MSLDYFNQREQRLLGERFAALFSHPGQNAARGVTVSTLRCTPEQFLQNADFAVHPSPFCANGFVLEDDSFKPGRHPYYAAGVFYPQEPSASGAAPLLGVSPGMRVLDMCAAPGGKSCQLAAALQGQGILVANEYVAARAEILKQNLERMGVPNAVVLNETPERIAQSFPAYFDRILTDVPCSGEGMFRKEPEAVAQHSEALVEQCASLGKSILECAAAALAPGGELLYSTCTFSPQEDEAQIGNFLHAHPEFELLSVWTHAERSYGAPGETNRMGEHPFDPALVCRIWPCHGGEGHFIALLRKQGNDAEQPCRSETKAARKGKPAKNKGAAGDKAVLGAWNDFVKQSFPALAEKAVLVRGENVFLPVTIPENSLHILRSGVYAGAVHGKRFEPSHQLFTAYGTLCANREPLTLSDPRTLAYLHGEEIDAACAENGWCCVTVDGFPMGGAKVSGGRAKNHYPKALRLL